MSTPDVLRLEEYRGRREERLQRALALGRGDPVLSLVLERLGTVAAALRADRAVAAWIDEYGEARAHPYAVLDLAADRPRRHVDVDLLIRSWRAGVPGLATTDTSDQRRRCVSLGSDGLRLWFVFVEGSVTSPPLTSVGRDALMFLAGECAAILLHQDLALPSPLHAGHPVHAGIGTAEGPERPGAVAHGALVQLAYHLLDEAMLPVPELLEHHLEEATLALSHLDDSVGPAAVVDAARRADPEAMARGLATAADAREQRGAWNEAAQLYELAYAAACQAGACRLGGKAARGRARVLRRAARWDEALAWYGVARGIARSLQDPAEEAVVLDGIATVHLGCGRVPAAREVLAEARSLAERSGDPDARAAVRFSLMTVAHTEGRLEEAATHGWEACRGFGTRAQRLRALTALGGVFLAGRRLDAAEDAFTVVERESREAYYRMYALAGLARIEAARGDRSAYEEALARVDEAGLEGSAPEFRAEAFLERGDGYRELGALDEARASYREAVRVAETHRVSEFLIRAEQALDALESDVVPEHGGELADPVPSGAENGDVAAVRAGLEALRLGRAAVGGS